MKSLKDKLKNTAISTVMVCVTLFSGCTTTTSKKDTPEDKHYLLEEVLYPIEKPINWIKEITTIEEDYNSFDDDEDVSPEIEELRKRIKSMKEHARNRKIALKNRRVKPKMHDPNVLIPEAFLNKDGTLKSDDEIDKIRFYHFNESSNLEKEANEEKIIKAKPNSSKVVILNNKAIKNKDNSLNP